jgi:hypothetical protein
MDVVFYDSPEPVVPETFPPSSGGSNGGGGGGGNGGNTQFRPSMTGVPTAAIPPINLSPSYVAPGRVTFGSVFGGILGVFLPISMIIIAIVGYFYYRDVMGRATTKASSQGGYVLVDS